MASFNPRDTFLRWVGCLFLYEAEEDEVHRDECSLNAWFSGIRTPKSVLFTTELSCLLEDPETGLRQGMSRLRENVGTWVG